MTFDAPPGPEDGKLLRDAAQEEFVRVFMDLMKDSREGRPFVPKAYKFTVNFSNAYAKLMVARILTMKSLPRTTPSCPASFLLDLLIKPQLAQDMQANLEEVFPSWIARHGPRRAKFIYHAQVGRLIIGTWTGRLLTFLERIAKIARQFSGL